MMFNIVRMFSLIWAMFNTGKRIVGGSLLAISFAMAIGYPATADSSLDQTGFQKVIEIYKKAAFTQLNLPLTKPAPLPLTTVSVYCPDSQCDDFVTSLGKTFSSNRVQFDATANFPKMGIVVVRYLDRVQAGNIVGDAGKFPVMADETVATNGDMIPLSGSTIDAVIKPGHYTAQAKLDAQTLSASFDVKAGEEQQINLGN